MNGNINYVFIIYVKFYNKFEHGLGFLKKLIFILQ